MKVNTLTYKEGIRAQAHTSAEKVKSLEEKYAANSILSSVDIKVLAAMSNYL